MADTTKVLESGLKPISKMRREYLSGVYHNKTATILEIGALDYPTFLASEGGTFYADHFNTEQCRANIAKANAHSSDEVVGVDFVLAGKTLKQATGRTFDLVVANHVIEHIPDVISWLRQISEITEVGGHLFLSVPDKRYTFDYFRTESDAVDMVRAYDERRKMPTAYEIAKHLYYHTPLRGPGAWAGNVPKALRPRIGFGEAMLLAKRRAASYTDVHCWVFTHESFSHAMWSLVRGGYIRWTIVDLQPPQPGTNEFRVLLRKK